MAKAPTMQSAFVRRTRNFACDDDGAAAVEFAIIAPVLLTCIVGILMLGISYYEAATVQWSLERTLRSAMVHPDLSADDIRARIEADLEAIGSPEIDFHYEIDDSGSVPLAVVSAGYEVPLKIPFVPDLALHFEAENVAPVPES
jgi:Flp pilus assembly pilin Flp